MKKGAFFSRMLSFALVLLIVAASASPVLAAEENQENRFNVVLVMDSSWSMNQTDPDNLRYEAVRQFVNLLTEKGNVLGGLVFSTHVNASLDPVAADTLQEKDAVVKMLKSVKPANYTNIGEALDNAVTMIEQQGNPDLPSVIVFLSDGETDMSTKEEVDESLNLKSDAVLRAKDMGINIYSVCLNANNEAKTGEMETISTATNGVYREINSADDLPEVFETFYTLIYGTSSILLFEDTFPSSGTLETPFDVPGIGVEEVNIVINGEAQSLDLIDPSGNVRDVTVISSRTFTLVKLTDVRPGEWTLVTRGIPGDSIKVNMIYNTNLGVDVALENADGPLSNGSSALSGDQSVNVRATLRSGKTTASSDDQYVGYSAALELSDGFGSVLEEIPMSVENGSFSSTVNLPASDKAYYLTVHIKGNYLEKDSQLIGPIFVEEAAPPSPSPDPTTHPNPVPTESATPPSPTPAPIPFPEPVQNPVEATVYLFPFINSSYVLDLTTLATDPDGRELMYTIESSSFKDTDYSVTDNVLTLSHFSSPKGFFEVRATNSAGLYCDNIQVKVKSHNVALWVLIAIGVGGLVALGIVGYGVYRRWTIPWKGLLAVETLDGNMSRQHGTFRGRLPLSYFAVGGCGLDMKSSYFRADPGNRLVFRSKIPFYERGEQKTEVEIFGFTTIYADKEETNGIVISTR